MNGRRGWSARFATWVSNKVGSTPAFMIALVIVIVWAATGPIFHFSDTWQLVINTGTTIVTFLMVFLIQHAQNRESLAVQLKLNEIVAALEGASNRLVSVEDLDDEDLDVLHAHYRELALMAEGEKRITESHSVDEAKERHERKSHRRKK
jgi:low affinity Fe/Cu permease